MVGGIEHRPVELGGTEYPGGERGDWSSRRQLSRPSLRTSKGTNLSGMAWTDIYLYIRLCVYLRWFVCRLLDKLIMATAAMERRFRQELCSE